MHFKRNFFNDLPEAVEPMATDLGYDYAAMVAAKDRLLDRFHNLDPKRIRSNARGGLVGAHRMLGADADLMAWLSFRCETLTRNFRHMREGVAAHLDRPVRMGCGPRSAAFAPLCGYDFVDLAEFMDFLLPKHYFFHRGFDGFIGTVYRYEKSGTLAGLTRVRGMTQDDAHIYVTADQVRDELTRNLDFVLSVLRDYGLQDFYLELSTKEEGNPKFIGDDSLWAEATETLREVAEAEASRGAGEPAALNRL